MKKRTEFDVQKALCEYVAYKYPKALYFSDLAGTHKRATKEYLLRRGRGWPDWFLFELMDCRFNGLMLELKKEGQEKYILNKNGAFSANVHIQEQLEKIMQLRKRGFCAGFAVGAVSAQMVVDGYLSCDLDKINKFLIPKIKPIL